MRQYYNQQPSYGYGVRRRGRRRRNKLWIKTFVYIMFLTAIGYIIFIAVTQPNRLNPNTAPAFAEAGELDGALPNSGAMADTAGSLDGQPAGNTGGGPSADSAGGRFNEPPADISDDGGLSADSWAGQPPADSNALESGAYDIYMSVPYAQPDKISAYESYQAIYPRLDAGDVVWQVNAGLDKPFYEDPEIITDSNPLLVNPYHRLPENFAPSSLAVIDENGREATPETIDAFSRLREAARASGYDLAVQSAYRTIAYQQSLYDRENGDGSVARPMFSEHHTGRALDLWGPGGLLDEAAPTATGQWVAENAHEYGFIVRYTAANQDVTGYIPEPWHIVFVGTEISNAMVNGGYGSLEEFVAKNPGARLP